MGRNLDRIVGEKFSANAAKNAGVEPHWRRPCRSTTPPLDCGQVPQFSLLRVQRTLGVRYLPRAPPQRFDLPSFFLTGQLSLFGERTI